MKVFISWSGPKARELAEILREWLPAVLQAVKPYFSPDDIAKGTRWDPEISKELDESNVGVICLTQENLEAPWIMFEAGALSKKIGRAKVCPVLFGVDPTDLKGPLVQFQAAKFEKTELKRLVVMLNEELQERQLPSKVLDGVFEMWWPKLQERVSSAMKRQPIEKESSSRTERDLLEEILALTRSNRNRSSGRMISPGAMKDLSRGYISLATNPELATNATARNAIIQLERPIDYLLERIPSPNKNSSTHRSYELAKAHLRDLDNAAEDKFLDVSDLTDPDGRTELD